MQKFSEMGLSDEIYKAISEMGFENPTPIQEKTIPAISNQENDLIGLAQTGTGKTAGFGLPILNKVDLNNKNTQAIVLCPTRELCLQIASDLNKYAKYTPKLKVQEVYGGASIVPQINALKAGAQIVVGTPGRTLDLINRKVLKLNTIRWVVLDEADEMLNMGFKEELDSILKVTPDKKQTFLFSATMPSGVRSIANKYMNKPEEISVGGRNTGADNVIHHSYMVKASDKYMALRRLIDINTDMYGIVFCRTRRETKEISDKLMTEGYKADALHGDLSQAQRDSVMGRFRSRHLQVLVATDVAARGLDVSELTHVINFNLPDDPEVYIHRSGRTGRAGKFGISIAIIHSRESQKLKQIERITKKQFEAKKIPGGKEICEKRLFTLIENVEKVVIDEAQIASFIPDVLKKLSSFERDELIKRFVSVEFNHFLEYYRSAKDINITKDTSARVDRVRKEKDGYARFFINLGTKHNLNTARLIGIVNDATGDKSLSIGKIDILRKFSFFEVEKGVESKILSAFTGQEVDGIELEVQLSKPEAKPRDNNRSGSGRSDRSYSSGGGRSERSSRGDGSRKKDSGKPRRDSNKGQKKRY
ncbi:MAG: DEAD/DEAH box helicase [Salinivirgaceae bacterium]|jgi:ATP-dependent RNA helicase DeaD|nr:DEAD/DEAH box helicase [Salinivirgaceae bacterium]